ncbi:GC-rich sequence DNA-binding factor-like protein-domain-containing protein [Crucibulum laeve]|uniref:GC-rich sequence DNA-binding factor-like protein-domain-containing protein n=1 Tax=Crucibulum laeve TaxID=68775 RepID=A0A5C3M7P6_9AGAR|nr:GC-rich sequence DNA-binding factor-like protein-domain-containing protein [Crucibulum laeve]
MARRKRVLDDGDDSDSSNPSDLDFDDDNDPDAREERALFDDPYKRKRRKKNGKEDALYGVFGEDSEDEGLRGKSSASTKRSDWTKAPAFVSGEKKVDLDKEMEMDVDEEGVAAEDEEDGEEDGSSEDEDEAEEDDDDSDAESSRPASPRIRIEEEDKEPLEKPRMGGIGSRKPETGEMPTFSTGGIGSSKGGIGSSKGGIGSAKNGFGASRGGIGSSSTVASAFSSAGSGSFDFTKSGMGSKSATLASTSSPPLSPFASDVPSAFGSRNQRFNRDAAPSPKPNLPPDELAHFNKLQGTFGARMLSKMGWQAGTGLGVTGEGIVTPIESKLRPKKAGIAFKGFKEKTEQSKMEARRRGEVVSDDEDEKVKKLKKKVKEQEQKRSDVWKRPKKVKTKVEHKTYEQIIAEAGQEPPTAAGIGQIIDATGAVPREVSSLADISLNTWSPSNDPTRIPEVRHNIRLIADACKSDLDGLAREAKALEERKKFAAREDGRLRKKVEDEAQLIARLQQIKLLADDINTMSQELTSVYEVNLEPFSPLFHRLADEFSKEFDGYQLDEIVVAAIAPLVRRMVAIWSPLEDPSSFISTFRGWRRVLKVNNTEEKPPEMQIDVYGTKTVAPAPTIEKPMTPFESLLWNVWLPKVRTAINNDWSPEKPQPAVKLYESWSSFLPPFIRDNLLDQLILPKVQKAVVDWSPKRSKVSLQSILFPWLPYVGLRLEDVVGDARRKVKNLLRSWTVAEDKPTDLLAWKDVFDAGDWDAMILKYVVPKLGATLRNEFRVNPRDQKMEPLQHVLQWVDIIRPSIFSQIVETEFFPKWLDVLHVWLIQPRVSFEEVAQWYSFWKSSFPEKVQSMSGVSRGFTRGLQLMNKAIELGPDAPTQLPRPDFRAEISAPSTPTHDGAKNAARLPARPSARTQEITFRSIVEEFAASHNLLFVPTGRAHEQSRMPLFRVSQTADGKGGLLVYILDDAVWAPKSGGVGGDGEEFRAISLEDMVLRAMG